MTKRVKTGGRVKGQPNKLTTNAKDSIVECFRMLGGVQALYEWAKDNKTDFYKVIYPKVLPLTLSNDSDNPLTITINYPK